jgi:hypothetical protein
MEENLTWHVCKDGKVTSGLVSDCTVEGCPKTLVDVLAKLAVELERQASEWIDLAKVATKPTHYWQNLAHFASHKDHAYMLKELVTQWSPPVHE